MTQMTQMRQAAPYPEALAEIVSNLEYRPGWRFTLTDRDRGQGSVGLTFNVLAQVQDSVGGVYQGVEKGDNIIVSHQFIVPAAAYNHDSWMRWVLNRILDVEQHEACEYFRVNGQRVYAPHHSEGEDPYIIWQIGDAETANKRSSDR